MQVTSGTLLFTLIKGGGMGWKIGIYYYKLYPDFSSTSKLGNPPPYIVELSTLNIVFRVTNSIFLA